MDFSETIVVYDLKLATDIHVIFNDHVVNSRYCSLSYAHPPDQQYLPIWKKSYLKFSSGQEIFLFTNIGQRLIIKDNRRLF